MLQGISHEVVAPALSMLGTIVPALLAAPMNKYLQGRALALLVHLLKDVRSRTEAVYLRDMLVDSRAFRYAHLIAATYPEAALSSQAPSDGSMFSSVRLRSEAAEVIALLRRLQRQHSIVGAAAFRASSSTVSLPASMFGELSAAQARVVRHTAAGVLRRNEGDSRGGQQQGGGNHGSGGPCSCCVVM